VLGSSPLTPRRGCREVLRGLAEEYKACGTPDYGSWDGGVTGIPDADDGGDAHAGGVGGGIVAGFGTFGAGAGAGAGAAASGKLR
jgi:hypothetical protein